jgi:hypothetical protein
MARKPPANPAFDDCFSLVNRAGVHLKAIHTSIERFRKRSPYAVRAHVDPNTFPKGENAMYIGYPPGGPVNAPLVMWRGEDLIKQGYIPALPAMPFGVDPREIVISGHSVRELPARRFGLLITDTVNNLRSALDHAVWHLSVKWTTPPPDPIKKGSRWASVGWPAVLNGTDWKSACGSKLFYVEPSVRAVIKRSQPFTRRKQQPERDEFAVLDELWRIHKHRQLPLVESTVGIDEIVSNAYQRVRDASPPSEFPQHVFTLISERRGPFQEGAELGRAREGSSLHTSDPEMKVDAKLAIDIAFKEGPAYGEPVERTLQRIRDEVVAALEALEPYF